MYNIQAIPEIIIFNPSVPLKDRFSMAHSLDKHHRSFSLAVYKTGIIQKAEKVRELFVLLNEQVFFSYTDRVVTCIREEDFLEKLLFYKNEICKICQLYLNPNFETLDLVSSSHKNLLDDSYALTINEALAALPNCKLTIEKIDLELFIKITQNKSISFEELEDFFYKYSEDVLGFIFKSIKDSRLTSLLKLFNSSEINGIMTNRDIRILATIIQKQKTKLTWIKRLSSHNEKEFLISVFESLGISQFVPLIKLIGSDCINEQIEILSKNDFPNYKRILRVFIQKNLTSLSNRLDDFVDQFIDRLDPTDNAIEILLQECVNIGLYESAARLVLKSIRHQKVASANNTLFISKAIFIINSTGGEELYEYITTCKKPNHILHKLIGYCHKELVSDPEEYSIGYFLGVPKCIQNLEHFILMCNVA